MTALMYSGILFTSCTNQDQEETEAMYLEAPVHYATDDSDAEVPMDKGDEDDEDSKP